ncbi:MAG TPA: hypothetical protein PKD53_13715 [Chloroflexaceae bacterium]|nr:hypothetical protein [Chloroflexaceae bacterium]
MTQTVRGIFYTPADAERAIADLIGRGFPRERISLIGPGSPEAGHVKIVGSDVEHVEDLAIGAVGGGLLGGALGALVGMIVVAIPGIGPVLLAGPLAAALGGAGATMVVGAGAGAVGGGVLGALAWAGISQNDAHVYEEFIRRGGTLVMVQAAGAERELASEILHRDGAAGAAELEAEWRREGLV